MTVPPKDPISLRVLLVEDDPIDAKIVVFFAGMLKNYVFDLKHVDGIDGAWQALSEESFDICLLDYWVGRQTGLRLLTSLEGRQSHTATIVLSNIALRDVETLRLLSGGSQFLSKGDCSAKSLEAVVQAALQSRRTAFARGHAELGAVA